MKALLLLNLQIDFCAFGNLAIPGADAILNMANELMPDFEVVAAAIDWHPPDHQCFAANHPWRLPGNTMMIAGEEIQLWPMHCVQHSFGAAMAPSLHSNQIDQVFYKGMESTDNGYNAFSAAGQPTGIDLHQWLQIKGVRSIYIMGMCTEYSVLTTALAAARLDYNTCVIQDAIAAIDFKPGDGEAALQLMEKKGVQLLNSIAIK